MRNASIGIIGMGTVGASTALSILHKGICNELLLCDLDHSKAEGEAMDLNHGSSFYPTTAIKAVSINELLNCNVIIITAGRGGKPGESRLELLNENIKIVKEVSSKLTAYKGILVIVSNPVDVLTYCYQKFTGLPANKVIGTGTMLDTARLREVVGRKLEIDPRNVHAQLVGEHGDSQTVLWSSATIGGVQLRNWEGWNKSFEKEIEDEVRGAAQSIIKRKGATNHAIGLVTATLVKWILRGDKRIINLSTVLGADPELKDYAFSLPVLIGSNGVDRVVLPEMNAEEKEKLEFSAKVIQDAIKKVEI